MSTDIQAPQATMAAPLGERAPTPHRASDARFSAVFKTTQAQMALPSPPLALSTRLTVRAGDTLTGLIKENYHAQGLRISEPEAYRQALQLARDNQIKNPDLIRPGETIRMDSVAKSMAALLQKQDPNPADPMPIAQAAVVAQTYSPATSTPIAKPQDLLGKTLQRAIDKGYLNPDEGPMVAQKVISLSEKYKFQPDDFARLTLMESGGMNPKATNGRCHGIIQFCSGATKGAAAVGMAHNPRAILGMGLLQQLDLVDTYFEHVGLADGQKAISLDELYLAVLTPAARAEQRPDAPLAIPGKQAKDLHVGGNRNAPITRNSIIEGLHALARRIFDPDFVPRRQLSLYTNQAKTDG